MRKTLSVLKMHWRDKWSWLYIPWIICLASFLVNVIIGVFLPSDGELYSGGLVALFIYFFVSGILTPAQTFPFALGMGVRRKDYFLGTAAMAVAFSVPSAAVLALFSWLEQRTGNWGLNLHFFHLPFVHEGPVLLQWLTMLLLLLFVYFGGLLIAGIYRRCGKVGLLVFFGCLLLMAMAVPAAVNIWGSWAGFGQWLAKHVHSMNELALPLFVFTLIFLLASYLLFRRATV